ncbi:MAG: hypothetical protein QUS12_02410, partial [Methanosarcina sp.]|nr:hypothetical protein [Methanosarcina sp.]
PGSNSPQNFYRSFNRLFLRFDSPELSGLFLFLLLLNCQGSASPSFFSFFLFPNGKALLYVFPFSCQVLSSFFMPLPFFLVNLEGTSHTGTTLYD